MSNTWCFQAKAGPRRPAVARTAYGDVLSHVPMWATKSTPIWPRSHGRPWGKRDAKHGLLASHVKMPLWMAWPYCESASDDPAYEGGA